MLYVDRHIMSCSTRDIIYILYIQVLCFIEAAAIQQSDDIEVLKKKLYKYQHSSDATVKRDMGVQFTFMEPVSGINIYNTHL